MTVFLVGDHESARIGYRSHVAYIIDITPHGIHSARVSVPWMIGNRRIDLFIRFNTELSGE